MAESIEFRFRVKALGFRAAMMRTSTILVIIVIIVLVISRPFLALVFYSPHTALGFRSLDEEQTLRWQQRPPSQTCTGNSDLYRSGRKKACFLPPERLQYKRERPPPIFVEPLIPKVR